MKINDVIRRPELIEDATGGGTSSGAIATTPGVGVGNKVGTLFGGSYKQSKIKKVKSK
jgi:hypothetical protein